MFSHSLCDDHGFMFSSHGLDCPFELEVLQMMLSVQCGDEFEFVSDSSERSLHVLWF